MTIQGEQADLHIADYSDEPNWLQIGWAYNDLLKASHKLDTDIKRYKAALNELDGAGTDIGFGKERIFQLREEIKQLEAAR